MLKHLGGAAMILASSTVRAEPPGDVPRQSAAITIQSHKQYLNDHYYADGTGYTVDADIAIPLPKSFQLHIKPEYNYASYAILDVEATKSKKNLEGMVAVRTELFSTKTLKLRSGVGIRAKKTTETYIYHAKTASVDSEVAGPGFEISFESPYIDAYFFGAHMLGTTEADFDSTRGFRSDVLEIGIMPRIAFLELDARFRLDFWRKTDYIVDKENNAFTFDFRQGFNIVENFQLFADFSLYFTPRANETHLQEHSYGIGGKARW